MFYETLKKLCAEHNKSITSVVCELGFSQGNLSRWKKGMAPRADSVKKFADYFGVSSDYLLGIEPSVKSSTIRQINEILMLSSEEELKVYLEMAKLIKKGGS